MSIEGFDKLLALDLPKQSVFAYLTCERLYPNYVYFSKKVNFGDPDILREAIDYLYLNIFEQAVDTEKIDYYIQSMHKNSPEPALFETVLASSALDACGVIYESLNFLLDRQPSRLHAISTMATDTVDMYIQDIERLDFNTDKLFQQKIDQHPLMKKERAVQAGIIKFLIDSSTLDHEDIRILYRLQETSKQQGNL